MCVCFVCAEKQKEDGNAWIWDLVRVQTSSQGFCVCKRTVFTAFRQRHPYIPPLPPTRNHLGSFHHKMKVTIVKAEAFLFFPILYILTCLCLCVCFFFTLLRATFTSRPSFRLSLGRTRMPNNIPSPLRGRNMTKEKRRKWIGRRFT